MDKEKLEALIEKLQDKLEKLEPTSDEYKSVQNALKEAHEMLLKEERAADERSDREKKYELEKDRLDLEVEEAAEKVKQAKKDNIWSFIGKAFGGAVSIALVFLLDEVKRESIIDKDQFSVARGWFPRG